MLPSFGCSAAMPMAGDNAVRRLVGAECLPSPSCWCCSTQGHGQIPGTVCQLLMPPGSTGWCQLWNPETRVLLLLSPPPHAQASLVPPDPHGYGVRCMASVIISCLSFSCCKRLPTAKQHTRFATLFPTAIKVTPQGCARQRNDS